jgi:type II restriction enzyme
MPLPLAEKAITEAQQHGKAILKFISANDAGLTGSHQAGFYLPKSAWKLYAPFGPVQGRNDKSKVRIFWQSQMYTDSVVTWYGKGKPEKPRSEYRLTCFGDDFPYLHEDMVGDLLVLIPQDMQNFIAYVIDLPDDIDDIQAALGVEVIGTWAVYDAKEKPSQPSEDDCIDKQFRKFAEGLSAYPQVDQFSEKTLEAVLACAKDFGKKSADDRLMTLMQTESRLFRLVERQLCTPVVNRLFKDIDDFVKTAATIMNRRRSRPSRSMENHVEYLLKEAKIPFDVQPMSDGDPSIIIPGKKEYANPRFPADRLFVVGVRNTCKGRWWQVTQDSPRVHQKHLITIQEGISAKQLMQMHKAAVALVVPQKLHKRYPKVNGVDLLNLDGFIKTVRKKLA